MPFDIPQGEVLPVDTVDVRLAPTTHPFEAENAAQIERNWRQEHARNAALFDGRMVLLSSLVYRHSALVGICHNVRYATYLYWRHHRSTKSAAHAFAHAALVTRDGALLAIRMGAHTVNPGSVYFAAGSFEPVDFPNGVADLPANMAREVEEETGLAIADLPTDSRYHAFSNHSGTVIFRRYYLDIDAETASRQISDFVASETAPEIAGPVTILSADDLPAGIMPHMTAIVRWHFGAGQAELVRPPLTRA